MVNVTKALRFNKTGRTITSRVSIHCHVLEQDCLCILDRREHTSKWIVCVTQHRMKLSVSQAAASKTQKKKYLLSAICECTDLQNVHDGASTVLPT
jgi:hypothetical protein